MNYNNNYYNQSYNNMQVQPSATVAQYTPQQHQADFNTYFGKLFNDFLQTSANFVVMFEDGSENLISLPQTALVRDLYQDIYNRLDGVTAPIGIYTDYIKAHYIPCCNETLQNMVSHFKITSFTPQGQSFTAFKLYIHIAHQNKSNRQKNVNTNANVNYQSNNLMINGKSVGNGFRF